MPDVTVASTTDTEEDVRAAAGLPADGEEPEQEGTSEEETPKEEAKSEEASSEDDEKSPKTASESESEKSEEDEEEEPGKKGRSVQKRIDKLTERNYELRERLARLEEALKAKTEPEAKVEPKEDVKPVRKDFKTDEEFYESLGRWGSRQEIKEAETKAAQKASNDDLAVIFSNYNDGVEEFKVENPDYDDVVGDSTLTIPMAVQNAIVSYEGEGPALAYYLAKNRDLVTKIGKMTDVRAVAEVGKIHSKLFPETEVEAEKKDEKKSEKKPEPKVEATPDKKPTVKKAPEPAKVVKTAHGSNTVPIDQLPYSEYRKVREQQERGRSRR